MAGPMTSSGSPTAATKRLGAILRQIRRDRGEKAGHVAAALGWSDSKVSRYELARTGLNPAEVTRLLDYYGINGDRRRELLAILKDAAAQRRWWHAYDSDLPPGCVELITSEQAASLILLWNPDSVPALLQTPAYAQAAIRDYAHHAHIPPLVAERLAQVRLRRQEILACDGVPQLTAILDESVLNRPVNGLMPEQLHLLAETAAQPNVTLRILPHGAQTRIFEGAFTLYRFGDGTDPALPDIVGIEHLRAAVILGDEADTYFYWTAFQSLLAAALSAEESKALILDVAESY